MPGSHSWHPCCLGRYSTGRFPRWIESGGGRWPDGGILSLGNRHECCHPERNAVCASDGVAGMALATVNSHIDGNDHHGISSQVALAVVSVFSQVSPV